MAKNQNDDKKTKKSTGSGSESGANSSKTSKGSTSKSSSKASSSQKKALSKKEQKKQRARRIWILRVVSVLVIGLILGGSLFFEDDINAYLRLKGYIEEDYSGLSTTQAVNGDGVIELGGQLNVHFVDVGQGDACIIELPDGRTMIIDGGKDKEKKKLLSYIEEKIFPAPATDTLFDFAILTHSDEDHCGGLDDVMQKYDVGTFYRPNQLASYNNYNDPGKNSLRGDVAGSAKSTLAYMRAIDAGYKAAEIEIVTDARDSSQNTIVPDGVLASDPDYYEINFYTPTKDNYKDANDYSPIIILSYRGKRIALSGDAEAEAEREFVELASSSAERFAIFDQNFTVDLIKLGHHGSRTSSSEDYLSTLTTSTSVQNVIIIISCGFENSYGHPHNETVDRLIAMGFDQNNILRTDTNGDIAMSVRQDDTGNYQLFHGAEMVRSNYASPVAWREIAIAIFILAATIILIQPLLKSTKKLRAKI